MHEGNGLTLCGFFLWVVGTSTMADLFLESINVASFHLLLVYFS
jgi:hypothetical protein